MRAWQKKLQAVVANLEDVQRQKKDTRQKEAQPLVGQARVLEDQAEYGRAIELYQKAVALAGGEQPKLTEHLAALEKAWKVKDDKHHQARQFIYGTWARLDTARKIQDQLARAREAFQTCRKAEDALGLEKLLLASIAHTTTLQKELEALKGQDGEDARDQIKAIEEVAAALRRCSRRAASTCSHSTGGKKRNKGAFGLPGSGFSLVARPSADYLRGPRRNRVASPFRSTTILAVRHKGAVAIGGDGQVTLGAVVMKSDAHKIRRLHNGKVLVGFAGARPTPSPCWSASRPS